MKRTSVSALLVLAIVGGAGMAFLQAGLANAGRPIVAVPFTLPTALAAIGAIVVSLAVPIRRMTRRRSDPDSAPTASRAVDPFYATRVVALAKASALSGALMTGAAIGALLYLLTRSAPPLGSVTSAIGGLVGAAILLVGGLVAESMCRVPPGDDDDDDDDTPIGARS